MNSTEQTAASIAFLIAFIGAVLGAYGDDHHLSNLRAVGVLVLFGGVIAYQRYTKISVWKAIRVWFGVLIAGVLGYHLVKLIPVLRHLLTV
jgi:hypothetical protein